MSAESVHSLVQSSNFIVFTVFDNAILSRIPELADWKHEHMSADMLDYIVDEYNVDIDADLQNRVKVSRL